MRYERNIFRVGIKMLNKSNIVRIIRQREMEISEIRIELLKTESDIVKQESRRKLSFLKDDLYRYKMQAKVWGIQV